MAAQSDGRFILGLGTQVKAHIERRFGMIWPESVTGKLREQIQAGSSFDLTARIIAEFASKYLGQPVIVVNKPGAGGSVAAADLISSKPDGYKFMLISNNFFAITVKTQKISFDPDNLIPIASLIVTKNPLFVKGDSPWKTLNDLLEYGKKNPGKLRWAHAGRGTILHVAPLLIFKTAGMESIEVPYKGTPEMVSAILGGHIDAASGTYGAIKENVKAGKLKILVFYSDRRFSEPSDVGTFCAGRPMG